MADVIKRALSRDAKSQHTIDNDAPVQAGDTELLATLGYKQELRRHYSTVQIFAVAFSIMGLLPSIASTLSFSMPAGPVGMVWGTQRFHSASVFIFIVSLAMADMASSMPTAGGLYFWTHYFAAEKWKNPLSFVVGYSNTIGLIGGICSIDYGFANMLLSMISIARDGTWTATRPIIYGTYVATVFAHGVIATFGGRIMPRIQSICIYLNIGLVVATAIALPVGKSKNDPPINSGSYVFGDVENLTTWPTGWAFMLAWLSPIWTIGAFDSCVHMSEEATHAARAVPLGIIASTGMCGILGFLSMAIIAAGMRQDIEGILNSEFGQPMAQIYYDALGKNGALGFMAVVMTVQFFMGLSIVIAASRQSWAFSRDGALPFSSFFRKVSQSSLTRYQPVRMVCGVIGASAIIGLLCLIDNAAANALFSLAVAGNDLAWLTPILARLLWGQDKFVPGEFYTGKYLSKPIAWTAVIYMVFAIVLCMIPTEGPNPSAENMNYTVVINGALWLGALLYYYVHARKTFKGPQTTVSPEDEGKQLEAKAAAENSEKS
ncbi:GABA-specific permease [Penicillium cataractarum]|uniref:GABA-specific permease n=1 Tax=Penicillium cataractarum TaxID=2100454 RepID=A0A9W9SPT8_9EURO|nr:GABA-specific permease [Penicillium cataractarum]KAJ5381229.1 GABA-specific permease [Penicillium cataractarum]